MSDSLLWFNTQIPKEILDSMVRDLKFFDKEFDKSVIWDEDKESSSARKSQNARIPTSHWISGFLWHYIRMANNRNFHYDLTCIDNHQLQYTCYEKGSYYTWHTDGGVDHTILTPTGSDSWGENPKQLIDDQILKNANLVRKLSFVLQLTPADQYEGGELQVENCGGVFSAGKEQGSLIFFDSRTRHRVTEVTKGTRKSLVGWVLGPEWK